MSSNDDMEKERKLIREEIARLQKRDAELADMQERAAQPFPNSVKFWGKDKVALVSYPRSGNSFLRVIIERLTGTTTGSDGNPERKLIKQLSQMGMKGEGKMDSSQVWCVKTHYPERVGRARLTVSRFILLIRNPFDCILSFFQMMINVSHVTSVSKAEFDARYSDLWRDFLVEEVSIWTQFHAHWRHVSEREKADTHMTIRYESLTSPSTRNVEVDRLARFLYHDLVSESEISEKLHEFYAIPESDVGLYTVKTKSASSNAVIKSAEFFSDEQFYHVMAATRSDLVRFDYWEAACTEWTRRTGGAQPDLVPYVDKQVDECITIQTDSKEHRYRLNSKFALRPRYSKDPYGRGFDIRWEERLQEPS